MATLENYSYIATFQFEWKLTIDHDLKRPFLLSKNFVYLKNGLFRVGFKCPQISSSSRFSGYTNDKTATLFLMTTNLKLMGLKAGKISLIESMSCSDDHAGIGKGTEMKEMNLETSEMNEDNDSIQLFKAPFIIHEQERRPIPYRDYTVVNYFRIFTVYLTGMGYYRVQQMDALLSKQLLSSITNPDGTDFKLIANDGKIFQCPQVVVGGSEFCFCSPF